MRTTYILRHLLSILVLPFTVTVVVPRWLIARADGVLLGWDLPQPWLTVIVAAGVVIATAGLGLVASTIRLFFTRGGGTLAPWDPPRHLVAEGVYRHVRNPMISGVIAILAGEALAFGTESVARWAVIFAAVNFAYIPLVEEPMLRERFGESYDVYRRHVPRWIPRFRAWDPEEADASRFAGDGG
ncbi:MAG TPA: isoprenylcysteine carboxylmethyltransferase family protein [Longimicrobiaceae bacterium]